MASGQNMSLLSAWASPFSMRVKLALLLKGIDLPQDLDNKSKPLLDSNPIYKKVPVLIHKGNPVLESVIIVQYLDEVWPENSRLLPQDPFLRAEQRFWADFIDKKVFDCLGRIIRTEDAAANEEFVENWTHLEGALQKLGSEAGPFFGGEALSFLDVILAPYCVTLPALDKVLGVKTPDEKCPRLHKWLAAASEHPSVKPVLPPVEKVEAFLRERIPLWRKA